MRSELEAALYRDMIRFLCRVGWGTDSLPALRIEAQDLVMRVPKADLAQVVPARVPDNG